MHSNFAIGKQYYIASEQPQQPRNDDENGDGGWLNHMMHIGVCVPACGGAWWLLYVFERFLLHSKGMRGGHTT